MIPRSGFSSKQTIPNFEWSFSLKPPNFPSVRARNNYVGICTDFTNFILLILYDYVSLIINNLIIPIIVINTSSSVQSIMRRASFDINNLIALKSLYDSFVCYLIIIPCCLVFLLEPLKRFRIVSYGFLHLKLIVLTIIINNQIKSAWNKNI